MLEVLAIFKLHISGRCSSFSNPFWLPYHLVHLSLGSWAWMHEIQACNAQVSSQVGNRQRLGRNSSILILGRRCFSVRWDRRASCSNSALQMLDDSRRPRDVSALSNDARTVSLSHVRSYSRNSIPRHHGSTLYNYLSGYTGISLEKRNRGLG